MTRIVLAMLAILALPIAGTAADYSNMYSQPELAKDAERYEGFIRKLYTIGIQPHLTVAERRALDRVEFVFPSPEPGDYPLNFYAYSQGDRPYVALPLMSIKMVEDLATAYAWIWANGYSFDTIDIYAAMLRYKPADAFPGGRYPPPLTALGIPPSALSDERVDGLSLRLRNSAVAFIFLHELGHVLYGHRGYEEVNKEQARENERQADRFALEVMERTKTIPMGAVMFFQAQVYSLPHRGQFTSDAEWGRYLASQATHPMTTDRLQAMAQHMYGTARRESRPAEADSLIYIATRLTEIASILEEPLLERCIAVVASHADPATLKPRRTVAGSQMQKWCGKGQ